MKTLSIIVLLSLVILGCQKELSPENIVASLPTLTTTAATSITNTTAASGGNITDDGGAAITARGVCWSTTANPTIALSTKTTDGTGSGSYASNITGLTAMTVYYVRAYATNSEGTAYGNEISFTSTNTSTALPTVTTASLSAITITTASSGGDVTSDGGATITARGVCWSTTANPDVSLSTKTTDGTGIGTFTSVITGLTANTLYHVRAYATNNVGTAYGGDSTFTTASSTTIPTITTTAISSLISTGATSGGTISADGGAAVTARGVCWSTTAAPVATGNHTTDGTGMGVFTSAITGLLPVTTYYVRAYATNSVGTAYGNEISFATPTPDVYIAGNKIVGGITPTATIWKNGVEVPLQLDVTTTQSSATSVYVSGTDIYAAGYQYNGTINKPTIWKNGVPTILTPLLGNANPSSASSVVVAGGDVYVIGNRRPASDILRLWKNGVGADVSGGFGSTGYSLFVSGTDTYIAGTMDNFPPAASNAIIWKNGTATILPSSGAPAYAFSVFVAGTDVHAVGSAYVGAPSIYKAMYWKNGVVTELTNGSVDASASSVFISGTDVYIAGKEYNGVRDLPKLWKNGVATTLSTSSPNNAASGCRATVVSVVGNDVYVIGTQRGGNDKIILWKNGVQTNVTDGTTASFCIGAFVQ